MLSQSTGAKSAESTNQGSSQSGGAGRSRRGRGGGAPVASGRGRGGGIGPPKVDKEESVDGKQNQPQKKSSTTEVSQNQQQQNASENVTKQTQQLAASKTNRSRNQRSNQQRKKNAKSDNHKATDPSDDEKLRIEKEKLEQEAAQILQKLQEEERKRQAERDKEKKEREAKLIESRDVLRIALDTALQHSANRSLLSTDNLNAFRKDFESNKKNLKTDLKKCTTFVKKVKSGSAWSMKASEIQQDIASLNLTRYVEEVVQAIAETNVKITDLPAITTLCIAMHQRYPEFLTNLMPAIWGVVNSSSADTAKVRRLYVRLITEFLLNGLIPLRDVKVIVKCITEWAGANSDYAVHDAHLIVAFGRAAGFEIIGITANTVTLALNHIAMEVQKAKVEEHIDTPVGPTRLSDTLVNDCLKISEELQECLKSQRAVPNETTETVLKHLIGAFGTLKGSLVQTHSKLKKLEKRCEQDRLLAGSISEAREKGLNDARKLLESLLKSVETLADCLNQPVPTLDDSGDDDNSQSGGGVEVWTKGQDGESPGEDFGPFDDEETRSFYCDIPDFITMYPPALLGLQLEDVEKKKVENLRKYGNDISPDAVEVESIEDVTPASEAQLEADENGSNVGELNDDSKEKLTDKENRDTPHYRLMTLLEQDLPECHRREQLDEIGERFCSTHGSSKNSRKRLQQTLFSVPQSRLDLLPYYSRMAATVDRVWMDISSILVTDLEQQFHGQAKYKKNQNLDSRMKTARYIGELTKFRVAPPIVGLRCMQRCIEDFTGSNVDVACCLLECCGRFLYRTKHASARFVTLMETMTRLSKAKNLDDRLQSMLKAAYFTVKPPTSAPRRRLKEYPPLETYLRHLLLVRLEATVTSISLVTKQLARLPWSDQSVQCGQLVCNLFLKACRKGRYKTIEAVAAVASKLRAQRLASETTVRLIDTVMEELRWSLEYPNFRDQQRAVTYARLLGELHNAGLVSGPLVLDQLYDFINVGHEIPDLLREASKKLSIEKKNETFASVTGDIKVFNSAGGANHSINEDEEVLIADLETKEEVLPTNAAPVAVSSHSKYDPRVPSAVDPSNSFYRITLVCTLLDVASKSMVTRNNMPRIQGFMAAFQRYLFTKSTLSTDVEFSVLDTLDVLDSQWKKIVKGTESTGQTVPRYTSWYDAHMATIATEESDALVESQKRTRLEAFFDDSKAMGDIHDSLIGQNLHDDDSAVDDDDDDATLSISAKDSADGHDDEMDSDGDGDEKNDENRNVVTDDEKCENDAESVIETDDGNDDEEEFDEETYLIQMQEEAFERELRRITMDALEKGKNASRKQVGDTMVSGSQIVKKKEQLQIKTTETLDAAGMLTGGMMGVAFQVLKKGNKGKVEAKELFVPADTNLAMMATKQDDAAARERDEIKQKVLRYEAESAEAEISGGNVYLEQEKLQFIRNRPLSMEDIDRNFGTSGGNLRQNQSETTGSRTNNTAAPRTDFGRGRSGRGGTPPSAGRGRGRSNAGGRTLFG